MPGFNIGVNQENLCDSPIQRNRPLTIPSLDPNVETGRSYRFSFDSNFPYLKSRRTPDFSSNEVTQSRDPNPGTFYYYVKSISRPTVSIDKITIHAGQDERFLPGKIHYNPVDITFYDTINGNTFPRPSNQDNYENFLVVDNSSTISLLRMLQNAVHNRYSRTNKLRQYNIKIEQLLGNGSVAWAYILEGAWPMEYSSSNMDHASSDISETTVKFSYDHALIGK